MTAQGVALGVDGPQSLRKPRRGRAMTLRRISDRSRSSRPFGALDRLGCCAAPGLRLRLPSARPFGAIALLLLLASPAAAQTADPEKTAAEMINPAAQRAIDQGLQWLASRQNDDGGFGLGAQRGNAAICGLCGMAFMSGGSTPGRGPYGDRVATRRRLPAGQRPAQRFHRRADADDPRADVQPRLRHALPGRVLRHVPADGTPRETQPGRQADRQFAEQGRRLALLPEEGRRRHLRDGLPGDGPAGCAQCGHACSQEDRSTMPSIT